MYDCVSQEAVVSEAAAVAGSGSRLLEGSLPSVVKGKHECFQCFKVKGVHGPVVAARSFCDN